MIFLFYLLEGVVIKSTGSWYIVRLKNNELIEARIKGSFRTKEIKTTNPIAVGDKVTVNVDNYKTYIIKEIDKRKNYIIRKSINLSKRSHIIAANIDQAILLVTISSPETYTGFIDRFLISAEAYHIPVIIVFNKIDLYGKEDLTRLNALKETYNNIGYQTLSISATEKSTLQALKKLMKNKINVIAGHSGVGKSTLINNLDSLLDLKTNAISKLHNAGKHTTTNAEMYPLSFGGNIIDTPGIKAFGLIDFDKKDLSHYFLEMRSKLENCQFNNCVHINEPNCAIKEAVSNGEIATFRYLNYLSMYEDDEDENYRSKGY